MKHRLRFQVPFAGTREEGRKPIVTVVAPAPRGEGFNSHVGVKLDSECRDTFDDRKDHSSWPSISVRKFSDPDAAGYPGLSR